jgi:hypothetical protein
MAVVAVAGLLLSSAVSGWIAEQRAIGAAMVHLRNVVPGFDVTRYRDIQATRTAPEWLVNGRWRAGWRVWLTDRTTFDQIEVVLYPNGQYTMIRNSK